MLKSISLMPHAVCWASAPRLIWTMVITNTITFLSYLLICCTLLYLVYRTGRVLVREWAYFAVGFALFIVACGSTHLLEVVTTWIPVFWIDAWANIITAVLSAYVAFMLIRRAATIAFGINDYADRLANTENERLQMQESLVAAQKIEEWSRMSAAVSHEIRGPLEAIQNLQYLIQNTAGISPEISDLARASSDEVSRVIAIAGSSLSFIRQSRKREPVDLGEAVASIEVLVAPLLREKSIDFRVEIMGNCFVDAFAGETRQVLLNIIRNACEAVQRQGTSILVRIHGDSTGVEVSVADEGSGIATEDMARLFQFGFTTKGEHGNGMGLWTVKHIIHKHGGRVSVDSKPGQGTRFTLWWPRSISAQHLAAS
jgi:signal transduction histidine kinase